MNNKELIKYFYQKLWNEHDKSVIDEIVDEKFEAYNSAFPEAAAAEIDGFKEAVDLIITAFPNMHFTIDDMVEEDDRVAVRWHGEGTWDKTFLDKEPTFKKVCYAGISIIQIKNKKFVKAWVLDNSQNL